MIRSIIFLAILLLSSPLRATSDTASVHVSATIISSVSVQVEDDWVRWSYSGINPSDAAVYVEYNGKSYHLPEHLAANEYGSVPFEPITKPNEAYARLERK